MKKRMICLLLAALLLACVVPSVFAEQAQLNYVTDEAELFSETERETLESRAAEISEQYSFGVYIVTLPDYQDYTYASSIARFAVSFYDDYDLGYGDDRDGVMLMLSMEERDYDLDFHGSQANAAFTESGRDAMEERFLRYFRRNDYYGGFSEYLDTCEEYLSAAESGSAVSLSYGGYNGYGGYGGYYDDDGMSDAEGRGLLALICGAIAAAVVGFCTYAPMRSAKEQRDADQYVVHGGLNLRRRSDMFLRRTVSRRPRQTESRGGGRGGHGGHGGGHSYSSGGHSGRSGKF